MNIKKINIMLGGVFPKELPSSNLWCGVDKGALYLLNNGINPILSCGDFDSITLDQRNEVEEKSKYFKVKSSEDLTDAEFALEHILELFEEVEVIDIYGATGRRLDHFFGNILLLNNKKYQHIKIRIIDDNNIITVAKKGLNIFESVEGYKYFSIVPMEEIQCGVKEAVESKEILESRYEDYKVLFTEKQNQKRKYIKER